MKRKRRTARKQIDLGGRVWSKGEVFLGDEGLGHPAGRSANHWGKKLPRRFDASIMAARIVEVFKCRGRREKCSRCRKGLNIEWTKEARNKSTNNAKLE